MDNLDLRRVRKDKGMKICTKRSESDFVKLFKIRYLEAKYERCDERERERERERVAKYFISPNVLGKLFIFLTYAPIFVLCFSFNAPFCFGANI